MTAADTKEAPVTLHRPAARHASQPAPGRVRWTHEAIEALFAKPFDDLMFQAQTAHRAQFDPNKVQLSTLLSIKTGGCSEDCGYCPQSARYDAGVESQGLLNLDDVLTAAKAAK
ncbi:MAG: biotin synthase BioB, partial [Hydrogenophaga sp.]